MATNSEIVEVIVVATIEVCVAKEEVDGMGSFSKGERETH